MIPLAAALYFLVNVALPEKDAAYGVLAPLTKQGCALLADRDHVCVRLPMPKRDPRCQAAGRCQ